MKKAFITGIAGQDGSYLAEFLLNKGYKVHGLVRSTSSPSFGRISHLYQTSPFHKNIYIHEGNLTDSERLEDLVKEIQPDELYHLGAMSHSKGSFDIPEYTANVDGLATLRLLEGIKKHCPTSKFYQASSAELYGNVKTNIQTETTPFHPRSAYGIAKLFAHWAVITYRETYGLFACNGILFNHESPRRGETFVSRKITLGVSKIAKGLQERIVLGNLDAKRDWGFAGDFIEAMWLMLQQEKAEDFILATGKVNTVRQFVELAFHHVGIQIRWESSGINERGINASNGKSIVEVSPEFFRPTEPYLLIGDASKARQKLGWVSKTTIEELVHLMVDADLHLLADEVGPIGSTTCMNQKNKYNY